MWIRPLQAEMDGDTLVLYAPNRFVLDWVRDKYINIINQFFTEQMGNDAPKLRFDIGSRPSAKKPEPAPVAAVRVPNPQTKASVGTSFNTTEPVTNTNHRSNINPTYQFDNFVEGKSNQLGKAAALQVAENPGGAYNPLFLYGGTGLGKTHLLHAVGNGIIKNNPNAKVVYMHSERFVQDMVKALQNNAIEEFKRYYRSVDALFIDDIQFFANKDRSQEEFFHTFNALYDARKQIVLTSDRPPKEIKTLEDRLRSRFEQDLIADIQPPDLETRIAIIKRKAELDGVEISDEVCEYVASKIKANIRQLEGTVKKIKAKYYLDGEKPTINSVQGIISDILNNDAPPEVTVERIIDEVARTYGVSADEIRSQKNRSANISNARHIAIYVTRELTTLSMVAIGEEFGNRHYSTIIYTIQKVQKMMEKDRKVKEIIDDTIKNIRDR